MFLTADQNHSEEAGSGSKVEELWPKNIWLSSSLQRWQVAHVISESLL